MSTSTGATKHSDIENEKKIVKIIREDPELPENGSSNKNGNEVNISVPSQKIVDELFKDFISQNKTNIPAKQIPSASSNSLDQMNAILDREISLISTQKSESPKAEDGDEEGELHEDSSSNQIIDQEHLEEIPNKETSEEKIQEKDKSSKKKHKKEKHKSKRHKDDDSPRHSSKSKHSKKKHKSDDESPRKSSSKKKHRIDRSPEGKSPKSRHRSSSRASSRTKDDKPERSIREGNRSSKRNSEERSCLSTTDENRSSSRADEVKKDHGLEKDFKIRVGTGSDEKREVLPETEKDDKNVITKTSPNGDKGKSLTLLTNKLKKDATEEIIDNETSLKKIEEKVLEENRYSETKEKSSHKKHKRHRDGSHESTSSRKKHKKRHKHESSAERKLRKEEKKRKHGHERDHPTFEDIHDHLDRLEESMETDNSVSNRDSKPDCERHSSRSEKHSEKKSDSKDKLDAFDKMKQIFEKVKREKGRLKDSNFTDRRNVEKVRVTNEELKEDVDRNKNFSNNSKCDIDDDDDDDVIFVDKVDKPVDPIVIDDDSSVIEACDIPLPVPTPETIPLPIATPPVNPFPDKIPLPATTADQNVYPPEQIPLSDQNLPIAMSVPAMVPNLWPIAEQSPFLPPTPFPVASVQPVAKTIPPPVAPSLSESFELSAIPLPAAKPKPDPVKLGLSLKISNDLAEFIASGEKIDKKGKRREEGEVTSESGDDTSNGETSSSDEGEVEGAGSVSETGSLPDTDDDKSSKKKKKKHKKKKKKSKKKESDKEKSKKKKESKSRDSRERSRDKDRKRSRKDRSRSRSRSVEKTRRESNEVFDRGWDAYSYSENFSGLGFRGKDSQDRYRRSRSRSRTRRSTSRSRSRRDRSRSKSKHSKSRRSRSRSRSRRSSSRSKSKKKKDTAEDLRLNIDKKKLRKIAIANALANLKSGNMSSADLASFKAGGKSVEELTDFCKGLAGKDRGKYSSSDSDSPLNSDDDHDAPFINHPFIVREAAPIIMNIRNSKQLPVMSAADKTVGILRSQFPVSSGNQHRLKELEWVPVAKTTAPPTVTTTTTTTKPIAPVTTTTTESTPSTSGASPAVSSVIVDPVFPKPVSLAIDIGAIVSERLQAVRKLQENPYDVQALTKMHKSQERASQWATSQYQPGTFTGSTGVQILSKQELEGTNKYNKAWLKKDQFKKAEPVKSGIGMFLLQKMGWKAGEGLGKNNEGSLEPLLLDLKVDRKGLQTHSEVKGNQRGNMKGVKRGVVPGGAVVGGNPNPKDLSGKHPVSALLEICNKRKFGAPYFDLVHESGPDHKKHFLFKVLVNGVEYQPSIASNNKKTAKSQAATVCLQELGMLPRTGPI